MKNLILLLFLLSLNYHCGFSQDTLRLYLDADFKIVEQNQAKIIRDAIISNGRYCITDQHADGRMIMTGEFTSVNPWVEDGAFKYYDETGELYAKGNFKNGNMIGKWIYYEKGETDTADYDPALEILKNIAYGNNKVSRNIPNSSVSPELMDYIQSNIHFPPRVRDIYPGCMVSVRVTIHKRMYMIPHVLVLEHPDFELEAFRLLDIAPDTILYDRYSSLKNICYDVDFVFMKKTEPNTIFIYDQDTTATDSLQEFIFVDEHATFMGGDIMKFREWVQRNVIYPPEAVENGEFGRITVQFVVTTEGDVTGVTILKGVSPALDKEVIRVLNSSPKWTPAKSLGENVNQQFVIPVIFMIR